MLKIVHLIRLIITVVCCSVLVTVHASDSSIAYIAYSKNFWQLWTMDKYGNNQKQRSNVKYDLSRISWFPDNENILINGTQGQLAKISIKTGKVTSIDLPLKGTTDAVISPNGRQIAFSVSTAEGIDTNNIWVVDTNGKNLRKITKMGYLQHDPVWGLNGEEIYFLAGDGKQSHNIFRVSLKTLEVEQLTVGNLYHFDLAINRKKELVFSSNRLGNYEIFYFKDKNILKRLTNNPALDGRPSWSPSMDMIAFESTRGGVQNIWQLNIKTKKIKQLTFHKHGAREPVWFNPSSGGN